MNPLQQAAQLIQQEVFNPIFCQTLEAHGIPIRSEDDFQKAAQLALALEQQEQQVQATTPTALDHGLKAAGFVRQPELPNFREYAKKAVTDPRILMAGTILATNDRVVG